jgi:hypothetical protein
MTKVNRRRHGYVSPYLLLPARTLAQVETDRLADAAEPAPKPEDRPPAHDRETK